MRSDHMKRIATILMACSVLSACAQRVPPIDSSLRQDRVSDTNTALIAMPAAVLYSPGPAESYATLERDGVASSERRTRSSLSASGTWTLSIEEAPQAAEESAHQLQTRLTLSADDRGVLLHELFNAKRRSTATFDPPLRLMPASLQVEEPTPTGAVQFSRGGEVSSKVRIVEGEAPRVTTRTGRAFASAKAERTGPHTARVTTLLQMTTGPAIINRKATFLFELRDGAWTINQEHREFSVRVGPVAIESDSLTAMPR